jgi:stage III sporulation protein AB
MLWFLKAAAALGCVAVAGLTGRRLGRRYVVRDRIIGDFAALCSRLGADIGFFHTPLRLLLEAQSGWLCTESNALVAAFLAAADADTPVQEAVEAADAAMGVKRDDLALIVRFFGVLGKSDAATQVAQMHAYGALFTALARDAAEERKKFAALYTRLGLLCGAAVGILVL